MVEWFRKTVCMYSWFTVQFRGNPFTVYSLLKMWEHLCAFFFFGSFLNLHKIICESDKHSIELMNRFRWRIFMFQFGNVTSNSLIGKSMLRTFNQYIWLLPFFSWLYMNFLHLLYATLLAFATEIKSTINQIVKWSSLSPNDRY